jgi:hypothetical protein
MKTKWKLLLAGICCAVAVAFGLAAYALVSRDDSNGLGLTEADLAMGGFPDIEALRAKTKAVADAYLTQHEAELKQLCGGPFQLTSDSSLSSKARALGHRSSFYYYCWDIYLPYSLQPYSGSPYIVLVQLSDGTQGHQHDTDKFRVVRAVVIDEKTQTTRTLE